MTLPRQNLRGYRFGVFEVDFEVAEVRKNGRKIGLQEKPFQILITNRGQHDGIQSPSQPPN